MTFNKLLVQHKTAIVKKWIKVLFDSYHPDTSILFQREKDPFANPVGDSINQGLAVVFDELCTEIINVEKMRSLLDPVLRVRAIQSFTASEAILFVFSLKKIIRKTFSNQLHNDHINDAVLKFETKIDELGLIAFDVYMDCVKKLYEINATEEKKRTFSAFERAGLIRDLPK